jgi:hypothetical protein
MKYRLGTLLTVIILAALGCSPPADAPSDPASDPGNGPGAVSETPEDVAARVMEAASTQDEEAFMAALTAKARASLASDDNGSFGGQDYDSYEIRNATIEGAEASVPVEAVSAGDTETLNLKLRQEDGAWRLYAIGMELAPGNEMTINFENIGEMLQGMVEGMGEALGEALTSGMEAAFQMGSPEENALKFAMFDALGPVGVDDFESSWTLSENLRGKTRTEALSVIADSLDLSIHVGRHADVMSEPVDFDTNNMTKLEAIERIANEAGLYSALPNLQDWGIASALMEGMADTLGAVVGGFESLVSINGDGADADLVEARRVETAPENAISFNADTPPMPPLFLGPFRLDLLEIEENVPHATGNLALRLTTHGLPSAMLNALETHGGSFQIHEVVDQDGNPLIDMGLSYMGGGSVVGSAYHDAATRELRGLLRSVDRIARVSGAIELSRPTSVEELDFVALKAGASQRLGDLTVTADQVDTFASFKITGPEELVAGLGIHAQPYGADGDPIISHYSDYQTWQAGEGTVSINTDETPSRVRLKFVLASEMSSYPFAFNDIPLMKTSDQPDQLAALDFGDHDGPLKMTFVEITKRDSSFSEATIAVENVSNKLPRSVFVDFVYLDGAGNELESFPHTINGSFTVDGWGALAEPGEKVNTEQTAFQMPEATQSIAFRFNHVEFMDGTRWEPDSQ